MFGLRSWRRPFAGGPPWWRPAICAAARMAAPAPGRAVRIPA